VSCRRSFCGVCWPLLRLRRSPCSSLFPSTSLFRSLVARSGRPALHVRLRGRVVGRRLEDLTHSQVLHGLETTSDDPASEADMKRDRKSTRLNSSHGSTSYAGFCFKKKKPNHTTNTH